MKKLTIILLFVSCLVTVMAQSGTPELRVLSRQCLYAPGDYGSTHWRIPAILTLPDGSLLAVNDKRKFNEGDLPQDIDIVARRSAVVTDGMVGSVRQWTEPVAIAKGAGYKRGYGDPGLVVTSEGDIICMFVGGNGFWASTASDPQRTYVSRSRDGGESWSEPEDITHVIWGERADHPLCRHYKGSFCASGNGLRLTRGEHAGRVLFVAAMCREHQQVPDNFVVYSDDGGRTWHVSDLAYRGGDEAKVVQLTDGRVLMSVRQQGARGYNISDDGGVSWGRQGTWPEMTTNACNGDMIRYSSKDEGGERDILIHSIPNSMKRENVSLFVSYDEGRSWEQPVTLCSGPSVYSSMTVLPDGTLGIYLEENPKGACELWYMNIEMPWK